MIKQETSQNIRERLSIRTYFLDAFYRLVQLCKPVDYQVIINDGIETYIRVMTANHNEKKIYVTNYMEDYNEFMKESGISLLIEKMKGRYDVLKNIIMPYYNY